MKMRLEKRNGFKIQLKKKKTTSFRDKKMWRMKI